MQTTLSPVRAGRGWSHGQTRWNFIGLALAAWRQRRVLENLPRERLDDLGLTETQARSEAQKPIWNVPMHWMR
jgi:uncharacterized protein YjiS (DUF1127 family)